MKLHSQKNNRKNSEKDNMNQVSDDSKQAREVVIARRSKQIIECQ